MIQKRKSDATLRLSLLVTAGFAVVAIVVGGSRLLVLLSGASPGKQDTAVLQAIQDTGRSIAEEVTRVTQPAIQRGRLLASSTEVADGIAESNPRNLTELCNKAIQNATEIDAIALFDAAGKIIAVNSIYADGQSIPKERVNKILNSDFSDRKIISRCVNNDSHNEVLEFQTTCDITPAFFNSSGLSVAHSVPVVDKHGKQLGVVSTRLRFERISTLIANRRIADGLGSAHFVTDLGGFFDESMNSGASPPVSRKDLAAITSPLASGNAIQLTIDRDDKIHVLFRVSNLKTLDGGGIQTMVTVPKAWVNREARLADLLSVGGTLCSGMFLLAVAGGIKLLRDARREKEASQRLAVIAQRTTNAVICCDESRHVVWVNEGFTRTTGYELQEVAGKLIGSLFHCEQTEPKTHERLQQAIDVGIAFHGEMLNRRKDGQEYWSEVEFQPIFNDSQEVREYVVIARDITEQTIERRRLQSVFAAVSEGIVLQNTSGEIVECNIAAERILGLTLNQLQGRTSMAPGGQAINEDGSLLPNEQQPAMITLRTGKPVRTFVFGIHTPQGTNRWISVNSEPIFDSSGKISSVVTSFADITPFREQSQRLHVIVGASKIGTWDWEIPTGRLVFNEHWAEMLGYELNELEPHVSTLEKVLDPDQHSQACSVSQQHIAGETEEYRNEIRLQRKNGSYAWVLTAGKIVSRLADGNPNRMVGIHLDITESKRNETQLKELTERYVAVTTGTSDGLWDWDCRSEYCWYSDRFWTLLGYPDGGPYPAPMLKSFNDHLNPEDINATWEAVRRHQIDGIEFDHECRLRHKNGEYRWFRGRGATQFDAHGRPIRMAGSIQDIHDLKSTQTSLIEANIRAEAANAAKSEFLANMSHEIRTPMTAILGFADLLLNEIDAEIGIPTRVEYVDTIRRNGEHLLEIINDVLDISKIEAGKISMENVAVNPKTLVHEVVSMMSVKAHAKGLQLVVHCEPKVSAKIQTDPVRLRQILVNLIGNAIKFTESGSVTIKVCCDAPKQNLHVAIQDTGIGLTDSQISRLFGAFEQADSTTTRKYGGTGLGLFISKRLAEMLGGRITVASCVGKGSTFTASVATGPVSIDPIPDHLATAKIEPVNSISNVGVAKANLPLAGMRILLAEDGPDNQRLISLVLRKAGAEVQIAENGKLAIEMLTTDGTLNGSLIHPCPFDLFLSDMQMPEMDGYTATRWLRAHGSEMPIVALTAHAMNDDIKLSIDAGCNAHATKPINKAALVAICLEWGCNAIGAA